MLGERSQAPVGDLLYEMSRTSRSRADGRSVVARDWESGKERKCLMGSEFPSGVMTMSGTR